MGRESYHHHNQLQSFLCDFALNYKTWRQKAYLDIYLFIHFLCFHSIVHLVKKELTEQTLQHSNATSNTSKPLFCVCSLFLSTSSVQTNNTHILSCAMHQTTTTKLISCAALRAECISTSAPFGYLYLDNYIYFGQIEI